MKTIHPAIAEHVMEENERLRAVVSSVAAEQFHTMPWGARCSCSRCELIREARAALSQQAEPVECPVCCSDEPHTGTCGSSDPRALCNRTQTEQQPVSWQFYQDGKWWNGDDRIKDHRKNTEAAGIPVRDLYAAPIAQTAPQPEYDDTALFDALYKGQVAAEKAGMVNGTTQWGLCLLRHIRAALTAQGPKP